MYSGGKPVLPRYTTTIELPFGSIIQDIHLAYDEVHTKVLSKKITPAPYPVIEGSSQVPLQTVIDETVYTSKELYPDQWITTLQVAD